MVLALDYDGTLVPICQKPEQARPDLELLPLLQALALEVILAILTGRNRKDMAQWIPDPAVTLVTSHGAEWRHDGVWRPLLLTQGNPGSLKTLAERVELAFENVPGVILEKKGATVAFHYRLVDPLSLPGLLDRFERLVGQWKEENAGFEVLEGKAVREIRPQGLEKGRALRRFLAVLDLKDTPVMAMGDDRTDEDMFRSLKDGDLSILVGGGDTSAAVRLRDVGEARHVLREILRIRQEAE
jgi:trehalose 6-phosphate synthase/phosphatase